MEAELKNILIPAIAALAFALILVLIRNIAFRLLHKWSKKTETKIDDLIIESFKTPYIYLSIAISLYAGIAISDIDEKHLFYINKAIQVIVIFAITFAAANITSRIFKNYIQESNLPIPTTGLVYGLFKGLVIVTGFMIILTVIGVSITPLLTALGVGGLAVALALKDTLSNLFAGVHMLVEKSIRVGDYIKIETGQEGFVEDITWRTTRIRMLSNNIVVIPNNRLAQSIAVNYFLPEKRIVIQMPVSVSYFSDPEIIEKILLEEVRKAAMTTEGLLQEPEPSVRFSPGFGESSLDFTVVFNVREITDQYAVQHELRKRIFNRFKEEGIEIPYPHRTVYLREEKDWKK